MSAASPPWPPNDTLHWLPADGRTPAQLFVLLHGWGASAQDMVPLAQALRQAFDQAVLLAPQGFEPVDSALAGRQWFSLAGIDDANRPARVAAMLPRLLDWVRQAQTASGVSPEATALIGFSQGAIVALELAQAHDGVAGRVLAFSGRYARLPERALQHTTLHFFHGEDDPVISVQHVRAAMARLQQLQGDASADVARGVGHTIVPALADCALQRLRQHIPRRTWLAAMQAAAGPQAAAAREADPSADPEPDPDPVGDLPDDPAPAR